jgi:hypothetical protein
MGSKFVTIFNYVTHLDTITGRHVSHASSIQIDVSHIIHCQIELTGDFFVGHDL